MNYTCKQTYPPMPQVSSDSCLAQGARPRKTVSIHWCRIVLTSELHRIKLLPQKRQNNRHNFPAHCESWRTPLLDRLSGYYQNLESEVQKVSRTLRVEFNYLTLAFYETLVYITKFIHVQIEYIFFVYFIPSTFSKFTINFSEKVHSL